MASKSGSQSEAEGRAHVATRRGGSSGLLGLLLALAACTTQPIAQPGRVTKADVEAVKKEQSPDKLVERGKAFAAVADYTRAEQYFAAAIDAGGDERAILPMLVRVCVQDGRYRVAIEYCESHLKRHPMDMSTHFVVGTLYSAIGESKPARQHLETVVSAHPEDARAHYALAVLLRDSEGDRIGADKEFREYLRLDPKGKHAEEARASLLEEVPR
jgi:tetratricopeptide (TPR) repeat protein